MYTRRAKGSKQGCDTNLSTASVLFWTGRATPLKEPPPGLRRARSRPGALDKHPDCPARAACVLVVVLTLRLLRLLGDSRLREITEGYASRATDFGSRHTLTCWEAAGGCSFRTACLCACACVRACMHNCARVCLRSCARVWAMLETAAAMVAATTAMVEAAAVVAVLVAVVGNILATLSSALTVLVAFQCVFAHVLSRRLCQVEAPDHSARERVQSSKAHRAIAFPLGRHCSVA